MVIYFCIYKIEQQLSPESQMLYTTGGFGSVANLKTKLAGLEVFFAILKK